LFARDPSNVTWQRDLVWGLGRMGGAMRDPRYYEEAVPIRRKLPVNEHEKRELAYCLLMIGTLYEEKEKLEKGLPAVREACAIHETAKGFEQEHHHFASAYFRICYNAVCEAALAGKNERALELLAENLEWAGTNMTKKAFDAHVEHVRTNDPDLDSLRGTPEFDALFK